MFKFVLSLQDSETLPSAQALGKGPSRIRQRLCRAPTRQRINGQRDYLPSATSALGKDKNKQNPKK